jgi:LytS/YehU family sensor histidine kinase
VRRLDARLRLSVSDTGGGINGTAAATPGRGLALTRRRLQAVYGADAVSLYDERRDGSFTVTLELPAEAHAS